MATEDVTATAGSADQILVLKGVSRAFGHVQALDGVDLDLRRGEILGIVGDNGAGKSTLMKIVAGTVRPDAGRIEVDHAPALIESAADARKLGIEMIYQDLALFDNLTIAANIFIGREPTRGRGFTVCEDKSENRIRFEFDEKPPREACRLMRSEGWRWSPTAGAWQRQLNHAGRASAERVAQRVPGLL